MLSTSRWHLVGSGLLGTNNHWVNANRINKLISRTGSVLGGDLLCSFEELAEMKTLVKLPTILAIPCMTIVSNYHPHRLTIIADCTNGHSGRCTVQLHLFGVFTFWIHVPLLWSLFVIYIIHVCCFIGTHLQRLLSQLWVRRRAPHISVSCMEL